jgi:D-alanyl-D-alanine carboxypeptidase (penicillin-binding protein 5/6)
VIESVRKYLILLLAGVMVAQSPDVFAATKKHRKTHSAERVRTPEPPPDPPNADGAPVVRAASVVVLDAKSGAILHEKNADQPRPPASTQKLLTALIIAEAGNLDKQVVVEASDTWAEPTKLNMQPGDVYSRHELLQILLVHSMNDVARCLARDHAGSVELFAARMNAKASELGLTSSRFMNPNGLPVPGQYSTARDMARIARAAYHNPTIRSIVSMKSMLFQYTDGRVQEFKNTNRVLSRYPFCNGMKTGYTEAAGHCLIASGSLNGRDVIAVVLGDTNQIWQDAYSLLAWGLQKPTS